MRLIGWKRLVVAGALAVFAGYVGAEARRSWSCTQDMGNDFEWCSIFNVHNGEYLGGGAKTFTLFEGDCEGSDVGADSWLEGDLFGADDGYDSDLAQDYAESSSSVEAPEDTEFFGWYELHSNHWYNDFFICGSDMLEEDRVLEFEIT
jgi:hypothetical protein